jgi:hypothetical protein
MTVSLHTATILPPTSLPPPLQGYIAGIGRLGQRWHVTLLPHASPSIGVDGRLAREDGIQQQFPTRPASPQVLCGPLLGKRSLRWSELENFTVATANTNFCCSDQR